jgi:mRNA-degrading endonuclease RelE of RelBE toxin-antitoxin system
MQAREKSDCLSRDSGYNVARMRFEIILAPNAVDDLESLKTSTRAEVRDGIERHLRHEPRKPSKSRIKRLRGMSRPQYRLRVGDDIRVFYDVTDTEVEVLAIVQKSTANEWLERHGESDEEGPVIGSEG